MAESGTQIGTRICEGCFAVVPVKVNVNGNLYAYCAAPTLWDENGKVIERCSTRLNIGRPGSRRIVGEFLTKGEQHVKPEDWTGQTTGNEDAGGTTEGDNEGAADDLDDAGTIGDALRDFLR